MVSCWDPAQKQAQGGKGPLLQKDRLATLCCSSECPKELIFCSHPASYTCLTCTLSYPATGLAWRGASTEGVFGCVWVQHPTHTPQGSLHRDPTEQDSETMAVPPLTDVFILLPHLLAALPSWSQGRTSAVQQQFASKSCCNSKIVFPFHQHPAAERRMLEEDCA